MSQWTHITGCISVESSVYEERKGKTIIPFPEEQFRVGPALMSYNPKDAEDCHLEFIIYEQAGPKIKNIIKPIFDKYMPTGEKPMPLTVIWNTDEHNMSCDSYTQQEYNLFKKELTKRYETDEPYWHKYSYKDLEECQKARIYQVETNSKALWIIQDDVRHCSGRQMLAALQKVFAELLKEEYRLTFGIHSVLEWTDDFDSEVRYKARFVSNYAGEGVEFAYIDAITGATLATKTLYRGYDCENRIKYWTATSDKWNYWLKRYRTIVEE